MDYKILKLIGNIKALENFGKPFGFEARDRNSEIFELALPRTFMLLNFNEIV